MSVPRLWFRLRQACATALLIAVSFVPAAAQEEEPEFRPGLLVEYRTPATSLQRIDPQIAFHWGDRAPDPLLPTEPFTATWTGQLLIRDDVAFRFHAYVTGKVRVTVGETTVLESAGEAHGWISGPDAKLEFGLQPLTVTYERTSPRGRIQLYWSSDRFPLEPLPESQFFLPDDDDSVEAIRAIELRERGRRLFAAHRCAACHRDGAVQPPELAPALTHVGVGTSTAWLVAKLQHRHAEAPTSKMPSFGFNESEANSLLAWLTSQARPVEFLPVPHVEPDKKNPIPDGNVLLHSLGCLACHRVGELGSDSTFGGGDVSHVGARRSSDWLHTQLRDPSKLNPHARMPVFELSDGEREHLVEALAKLGNGAEVVANAAPSDAALVEAGKSLFVTAQCAACHELPERSNFTPHAPMLDRPIADWDRTCLSFQPDPAHRRPSYPQADRAALQAYVGALVQRGGKLSPPSDADRGRLVVEQRNCLGCHERGTQRGVVPTAGRVVTQLTELTGQSQALIPPNLTAVGDKLYDEPLAKSVRGEQQRRMPWLRVRMPKFVHSEVDQAALVAHFIETDRIPAFAPETRDIQSGWNNQELIAGRTLTGPHGFSCIACHECGEYVPPNVAIATHGSDLLGFRQRMRPEFFLRWTRSPLRVVPGIEMPSYERPVPGILDGDPNTQLIALWHAIGDRDFSVPTNPTAVEQLLSVRPGERTVVIRDVFSVSEACGGGYVARALAMGFDNGQSILFDLDHARVREWTLGEFARQRTQGKSWYWDMAGAPILKDKRSGYGLWLELPDYDPPQIEPSSADGRPVTLSNYAHTQDGVEVTYVVRFETRHGVVAAEVHETWQTYAGSDGDSVQRTISVSGLDQGQLLAAVPHEQATGVSRVLVREPLAARTARGAVLKGKLTATSLPDGSPAFALTRESAGADPSLTLLYTTKLKSPLGPPIEIPDPPAVSDPVTTAPGFHGTRLPITTAVMPTAMAWRPDGTLVFTSLKGHVYLAKDTDGDGVEDTLAVFEEGLAAPFGVLPDGDDLLVAHKPELLRLRDTDGDGRCDERIVVADGWGYTHDYHDWTAGPVRDADGNLFLAISSDYQQSKRDRSTIQWRGKVLQLDPHGAITPIAHELRFPMGIALDGAGRLFVSDQQGVQNCFNEINHIVKDGRYGVPALADPPGSEDHTRASVQVPHPWTRSVNGITFLPSSPRTAVRGLHKTPLTVFAGHGLGCEYNTRFLVRFTLQEVQGALQGAAYEFTSPKFDKDSDAFLGPICTAVSPDGSLYVGSIFDSGWLGGRNTGEIVKLTPSGDLPNGLREVRAVTGGFEIDFIHPVDAKLAADPANYTLSGYTRVWQGSYATPDSDVYTPAITAVKVSDDATSVTLHVNDLRAQHVYELNCRPLTTDGAALKPSAAHYSMNRVP